MENFHPCGDWALTHGLERKFLGFCWNFVRFKADSIYFSISHTMLAVWILLTWEKLWCIWPVVCTHCFLFRQVSLFPWAEMHGILKSNGNSPSLSTACLNKQPFWFFCTGRFRKQLLSLVEIVFLFFYFFFWWTVSGLGLSKFSEANSSEGQCKAVFWELSFRKVVAVQCLEVKPM